MSQPPSRLSSGELLDILALSENATAIYTTQDIIIQSANTAMLNFWGKGKDIIGKPLMEAVPALKGQQFVEMLKRVWDTGITIEGIDTPAKLEIDGELRTSYFDFLYRAILNPDGSTRCILHTATDVTDRFMSQQRVAEMNKQVADINKELFDANQQLTASNRNLAESQDTLMVLNNNLTESETQLQFAIDAASLGTWDLDPKTNKFSGNDRLKSWFGLKPEEQIELSKATDVIAEYDRLNVLTAIQKALQFSSGGVYDVEYTIINPLTQQPRIVKAKGKALFNIDNEVIRFSGTLQDITEERHAREELTQTNQRLAFALDAGKLGSYEHDLQSGAMICTGQFKANFGWPADKPFNFPDLIELVVPEYRKNLDKQIKNAVLHNASYTAEYEITWPDGSRHWINMAGKPQYNDQDKDTRIIGITYDITEGKTNEQRKDDFISIASHELKTPITTLKSSLQLLNRMKDDPSPKMLPKLIEQSNRSMDKISSLIEDLLNVSRMNEGQLHLNKSTFTISELLNHCCNHIRVAGKHDLIFQGDAELQVFADEHRIDQVIINLVNNAVKYAPNSREICLIVAKDGNMAKISVKDNGPGIDPEKLPHLFDRYYRADYSGIQYSGLGLGLYICSEIVRKHHGQIGAESGVGKGSTFWFTLPL
ncbi:PAS domain S-box protein [Mucilaginibacter terrigena]|uniref:histidine kinase n=1 Tax=Mucilaginibacter terrigena TaxID=2492395 RepID=A0A4Q5LPV8_9SPHI|nr:PAS domain-containing sensor histidine kinase [Mucilaginibacter terrigena]RYU91435.1 PAS domain S-box protein [Mucilaginibacter terrigena]